MLERFRTALPEHEGGHHPSREQDDSSKPFSIHETEDRLVFSGAGVIRQATLEFNRSPVAIEASPGDNGPVCRAHHPVGERRRMPNRFSNSLPHPAAHLEH
eukprot:GABV01005895.1.p3 GENE.GABV01005895.1~~GABV01005895.1.p3  ORF type:complete len:101 (+),score=22.29 GABV01005895.1:84-386(+)